MMIPDPKAPRMRKGKFSKLVITKELWKKFTNSSPEYANMTWKEFSGIWGEITEKIRWYAINNPLGVKLGSYMGEIKLQYPTNKVKAKDYGASIKAEEDVYYLAIESKGKVPKIRWERRWAVKFNKILQYYAFKEFRDVNEKARDYVRGGNHNKIRVSRTTTGRRKNK